MYQDFAFLDGWRFREQFGNVTGSALRFWGKQVNGQERTLLRTLLDSARPDEFGQLKSGMYESTLPINEQIARIYGLLPQWIDVEKINLKPGQYHPRIWKQANLPMLKDKYSKEFASTIQAIGNLFVLGSEVYRYIEPAESNNKVFGHRMREVLILACTEVEAAWKAILIANQQATSDSKLTTNHYVKLLSIMRLNEWEIKLINYPDYLPFKPFELWSAAAPTQSLEWYASYNAVKHDRESKLSLARLEHMIKALGACYVMLRAQFGDPSMYAHDSHYPMPFMVTKEPQWHLSEQYVPAYPQPNHALVWIPTPF